MHNNIPQTYSSRYLTPFSFHIVLRYFTSFSSYMVQWYLTPFSSNIRSRVYDTILLRHWFTVISHHTGVHHAIHATPYHTYNITLVFSTILLLHSSLVSDAILLSCSSLSLTMISFLLHFAPLCHIFCFFTVYPQFLFATEFYQFRYTLKALIYSLMKTNSPASNILTSNLLFFQ